LNRIIIVPTELLEKQVLQEVEGSVESGSFIITNDTGEETPGIVYRKTEENNIEVFLPEFRSVVTISNYHLFQ
jgi:hypothetical protein